MEKASSIFQLLSALFFGVALVFFLTYDRMWDVPLEASVVVSWLLVGLVLYLVSWGAASMARRGLLAKIRQAEVDKKELKAMVFDLERENRGKTIERRSEGGENTERDSSGIKPRENIK